MFLDGGLASSWRERTARDPAIDLLIGAWSGAAPDRRAAMLAARGELHRAGAVGGRGWESLARGDVVGALRFARQARETSGSPGMSVLEAEALCAAGAIIAGLRHLAALHARGDVAATIALARRHHMLADHRAAVRIVATLPMHAHAALVGTRAAVACGDAAQAWGFVEPFLDGLAPIPDPGTAGGLAVVAATVLARLKDVDRLRRLASGLLTAQDLPPEMMPTTARTAWTAGMAEQAWERFADDKNPWMVVARLELASLAGDAELMRVLLRRAGPLGAPAAAALLLLGAEPPEESGLLREGETYHMWRTHPYRWQPWIDAARQVAQVEVYDLAANELPDEQALPTGALDDSSLLGMLDPLPVAARPVQGTGVWIDTSLCDGAGIGHDWPREETAELAREVGRAQRAGAAVWVTGAERALAHASEGQPIVVIAPPGDPFWAGSLPERVWPAWKVIRAHPHQGWEGAGARAASAARALVAGH